MIPDNEEQKVETKTKQNNKFKTIIIVILVLSVFRVFIPSKETETSKNEQIKPTTTVNKTSNKDIQQNDFKKLYQDTLDIIYAMKKPFYISSQILTKVPKTSSYKYFKDSEEIYKNCSAYFTMATVPTSLKDYDSDIKQSFKELANVCVMLQNHCKYFADYINTNDLESLRKSDEIIAQGPIKIISNASGRLIYGVGEKIGLDPKPFNDAYKEISDKIPKEFETEFGN